MAFINNKKPSSTNTAAEVRLTKPRSALSAQIRIWVGKEVAASNGVAGAWVMKAFMPISSNGAASPRARARP